MWSCPTHANSSSLWIPSLNGYFYYCVFVQSYLALPKGGLTPDHVLIIPISHYASFTEASRVRVSLCVLCACACCVHVVCMCVL